VCPYGNSLKLPTIESSLKAILIIRELVNWAFGENKCSEAKCCKNELKRITHSTQWARIYMSPEVMQFRQLCNCRPFANSLGNSTMHNCLGDSAIFFSINFWGKKVQNSLKALYRAEKHNSLGKVAMRHYIEPINIIP
jgi:hypothetical protein